MNVRSSNCSSIESLLSIETAKNEGHSTGSFWSFGHHGSLSHHVPSRFFEWHDVTSNLHVLPEGKEDLLKAKHLSLHEILLLLTRTYSIPYLKGVNDILTHMKSITIYCDGSSIGNPGPGGWGAVIADGARAKELGGYEKETTNNRMELTAAIEALRILKSASSVTVHTDSSYVINGITKWVKGWVKNGWMTKEKKDVLNKDLWESLAKLTEKHDVEWKHVRGHSGIELNERVDMIANGYARKEKVGLFYGSLAKYKTVLASMPKARVVSKSKLSSKKTGPAYSYVSVLDGKVMTHKTWAECEKRVKGKPAKFKKVFSKEEEDAFKREWGR
jgi:ribonuclease HI